MLSLERSFLCTLFHIAWEARTRASASSPSEEPPETFCFESRAPPRQLATWLDNFPTCITVRFDGQSTGCRGSGLCQPHH